MTLFGIDDDARARRLKGTLTRARIGRHVEKTSEERIVEQGITPLFAHGTLDADTHHRWGYALDHRRERRHRRYGSNI